MTMKPTESIKTLTDLEDWIYWSIGTIDMEDVRELIDVIKEHKDLLEDHV